MDDLIGAKKKGRRDGDAKRRGGLHVDHQLELGGLLHWKIRGLRALQDLVYPILVNGVRWSLPGPPVELVNWRPEHESNVRPAP